MIEKIFIAISLIVGIAFLVLVIIAIAIYLIGYKENKKIETIFKQKKL